MRTFSGLIMGLVVLASPVMAQDYSNGPAAKSGQWDYSTGSQSASPGDSYEGYPPPPTQVIISPGMGGGYGGYTGGTGMPSQNGQTPQSAGRGNGVSPGGVGWGNTGMGNVGAGNIGAGNTGAGNVGYGNTGGMGR
ncbi:pentapeptide repeat-containing protein [Acetobacter sp. UBA5411]|mgnify:CR=1 FL=1|uniref:pentapeptide repeat-containing protein n=1 Tax=Acetobacter sp. UBA5411 TaxID=1945905 RepID=UPI0025C1D87B|nr:pentapeptide repeat-containing protein [Acetobacter sp. UBA5411]